MNKKTIFALAGILVLILTVALLQNRKLGAFNPRESAPDPEESAVTETIAMNPSTNLSTNPLIDSNTKFAFHLFTHLASKQPEANLFISPTSVALALAMTYNGAEGTTATEMGQTLQLPAEMNREDINQAFEALRLNLVGSDESVKLAIANSLWLRQDFPLKEKFQQESEKFYDAKVTELDFTQASAKDTINRWVKDNTAGKIEEIVEQITPSDVLYLINAIYFKGNWTDKFDKDNTVEQPFYLANGKVTQQPMMTRHGEYSYYENEQFQAVSLPYGKEEKLVMDIFLPRENSNLANFTQELNPENWQQWLQGFSKRDGFVQIPRFKLEYEVQLNHALQSLGMKTAFNPAQANFSAMSSRSVYVNGVKHKTFLEVNEEGTEAAGVTSVQIRATSIGIAVEPFTMVVDRPFFCAIRDRKTGSILFLGAIVEP